MTEYETTAMEFLKKIVVDGKADIQTRIQVADIILKHENNRVYAEQTKAREEIRG